MIVTADENGMKVSVACLTDTGRVRSANEDAFIVAGLKESEFRTFNGDLDGYRVGPDGLLLAVADGMGGAQAGEVASRLAIEQLLRRLTAPGQKEPVADRLRDGLKSANRTVRYASQENPAYRGMGATMTAALIYGGRAYLGHVGDSRGYLLRDGRAEQVTKDQSLVQVLIDAGQLTETQASHSPQRHIILQALGAQDEVEPETGEIVLLGGDHIVLCSDYLMQKVTRVELLEAVRETQSLNDACALLVTLANERGGEDNITVLIARFDEVASPKLSEAANQSVQTGHS
jgi:PPM family protein phosphatase